jgi:hypothetical protein
MYAAFDDARCAQADLMLLKSLRDASTTSGIRLRVRFGPSRNDQWRDDGSAALSPQRIMKAAHGQALVTQAVVDQVRDHLPPASVARPGLRPAGPRHA